MEKARQKQILIFGILSILVIVFIFRNSLPSIEESKAESGILVALLRGILDPFGKLTEEQFHVLVRKMAHLVEFAALGFCVSGLADGMRREFWRSSYIFFALFWVLAVAVSDEFLQSFTGRGSMVSDVVLDFTGGMLGIAAMCIMLAVLRRFYRKEG